MQKHTLVTYNKYLYTNDKCLKNPVRAITTGYECLRTKHTTAIAQSLHIRKFKIFAKIKVFPTKPMDYEKEIMSKRLPQRAEITLLDTLFIEKEISISLLMKRKNTYIKKLGFLLGKNPNETLLAYTFVPKLNKFTDIVAIPNKNIYEIRYIKD